MEKGLLQFSPAARVGINDASARQPGLTPLSVGLPEEDEGEEEEGEGNVEHNLAISFSRLAVGGLLDYFLDAG